MAAVSDPEEDELMNGPSLSADGRLEQRMQGVEPAFAPPAAFTPPVEPPLELAARSPQAIEARVQVFRDSARPRAVPGALKLVGLLGLLGAGLLAGFLYFQPRFHAETPFGVTEPSLIDQLNLGEPQPLIISSTPSGASVSIAGQVVGQTPWAGDNRWTTQVPVRVELPGYQRWEGKLEPGKPRTLDVKLKK